jgi:hypothetical protein
MANMRVAVHCAVSSASPDSSFGMIFLDLFEKLRLRSIFDARMRAICEFF